MPYAAQVPVLRTLHVFGAIFLLGGVSAHALLRPMAARATDAAQQALFQFAWRVELALVYTGSALVLITGVLLWIVSIHQSISACDTWLPKRPCILLRAHSRMPISGMIFLHS